MDLGSSLRFAPEDIRMPEAPTKGFSPPPGISPSFGELHAVAVDLNLSPTHPQSTFELSPLKVPQNPTLGMNIVFGKKMSPIPATQQTKPLLVKRQQRATQVSRGSKGSKKSDEQL